MKKIEFIENKYIDRLELINKLSGDKKIFNMLKENRLIKLSKDDFNLCAFSYVGVIFVRNLLIYVFPKVYTYKDIDDIKLKNMIKLFLEYSKRETLDVEEKEFLGIDEDCEKGNLLSIIDFILEDYSENGLYYKKTRINEINGNGCIEWGKTIDRNKVYFNENNEIIYYEVMTSRRNIRDDYIITKIHKYIINKCIELINELGILEILVYNVDTFDLDFSDIEDIQFIREELIKELSLIFNDRKIKLLKTMLAFINNEVFDGKENEMLVFGTRNFEIVWEKINSYIFKNQYALYSKDIPKPQWICQETKEVNYRKTIIPDIVNVEEDFKLFNILDAKYYTTNFIQGRLEGTVPGTEDIIKQLVYEDFLKQKYINYTFTNSFIIPTCNEMKKIGVVGFPISNTNKLINLIHMNIDKVISLYINNRTINIYEWRYLNSIGDIENNIQDKISSKTIVEELIEFNNC